MTTTTRALEPLPCPFCGGGATFEHLENGSWSIGCADLDGECMGYQSLQTFARKADAIAAWNRRASLTQPDAALVERAVMVCPQCEGEGSYADGLDEAACSIECTRCGGNGWIVDLATLLTTQQARIQELEQMLRMFVDAAKPRRQDGYHEMPMFSAVEISLARATLTSTGEKA